MPTISPTLPNDGETIDAQDVNGPFNAILGVLNGNIDDQNVKPGSLPWSVMDSFSNQIPASAMQDSGNLENFRADAKISFIPSGLIWSATTGLNAGMTLGEYYSNSGILLPITAITSRTFTASRDTYVSIAQNGSIAYSEVTNGAAQPALPSNSNWLAKVVTNGSAVTGVTDMRQTAPIASHNIDWTTIGEIAYAETGTIMTGITTLVDRTGLSITFNVPQSTRPLYIEAFLPQVTATAVPTRADVCITDGSDNIIQYTFGGVDAVLTGSGSRIVKARIANPTVGSHTYKVRVGRGNGTGQISLFGHPTEAKSYIAAYIC